LRYSGLTTDLGERIFLLWFVHLLSGKYVTKYSQAVRFAYNFFKKRHLFKVQVSGKFRDDYFVKREYTEVTIFLYADDNLKVSCFQHITQLPGPTKSRFKIRAAGSLKKIGEKLDPIMNF
jgi:hypothetical protein